MLDPTPPLLIDLYEVARLLSIPQGAVRGMVKRGEFPAPVLVGKAKRWRMAEVAAWVDVLGREPPPEATDPQP